MAGLFFSNSANRLTDSFNNYVDWSRAAELFLSNHRYSWDEIARRLPVFATMALGTYQGLNYAEELESTFGKGIYAVGGCFLGFMLSHTVLIILPLSYKRYLLHQECLSLITKLLDDIQTFNQESSFQVLKQTMNTQIDFVMKLNLSDEKHSRATQTWGKRRRLLEEMTKTLESQVENQSLTFKEMLQFWSQDSNDLMTHLDHEKEASCQLRPN